MRMLLLLTIGIPLFDFVVGVLGTYLEVRRARRPHQPHFRVRFDSEGKYHCYVEY